MDIVRARLTNERLVGQKFKTPEQAVEWFGAVQAQDYANARWGVGQRVENSTDVKVHEAFEEGKILRTHVMRPTWHFVSPKDIRWLLQLTGPRVNAFCASYYRREGLSENTLAKADAIIQKTLRGGNELTREEIAVELKKKGIIASANRLSFLLMNAELTSLVCSGRMKGKKHTYALVEERVPKAKELSRDQALGELAKRYFTSHGPALVKDFSWWSGLTMKDCRRGIEMAKLSSETLGEKTYWFSQQSKILSIHDPLVHLLPNYDEYFIAFRDRSATLDARIGAVNNLYEVFYRHIVFLNGLAVGGWKNPAGKNQVQTKLLVKLSKEEKRALEEAVDDYGKFLGMPVELV